MTKLTTLIKMYKLALSKVYPVTVGWDNIYIVSISNLYSEDTDIDLVRFIFSESCKAVSGSKCIAVAFSITSVERLKGGLDNILISPEYINVDNKINDFGRVLAVLNSVYNNMLNVVTADSIDNVIVNNVSFNIEDDLIVFELTIKCEEYDMSMTVKSDGELVMLGECIRI